MNGRHGRVWRCLLSFSSRRTFALACIHLLSRVGGAQVTKALGVVSTGGFFCCARRRITVERERELFKFRSRKFRRPIARRF